jgi:hypothetical protein
MEHQDHLQEDTLLEVAEADLGHLLQLLEEQAVLVVAEMVDQQINLQVQDFQQHQILAAVVAVPEEVLLT